MDQLAKWGKNNKIFFGVVAVSLLAVLCHCVWAAGLKEFWFDEVAIIGFVRSELSFGDVLHYYQTIEVTNLPLYALIVYIFYHLLPPENICILLPGILMVLGGIFLLVRMTDRMIGRRAAYAVLAMAVSSTTVINRMALELRSYALMFLSVVLVLFFMSQAGEKEKVSLKELIPAALSMAALTYSHYFGILYLAVLGIGVLIGILLKKKPGMLILPFFFAAAVFLPWFLSAMRATEVDTGSFWIDPPKYTALLETIGYLLGGSYLLCIVYGIGFLLAVYDIFQKKDFYSQKALIVLSVPIVMAGIFVYSRWINPKGGLYENRYFIVLLPAILYTSSYGVERLTDWTGKGKKAVCFFTAGVLLLTFFLGADRTISDSKDQYDRFSYAPNYMIKENELDQPDVLLIYTSYGDVSEITMEGWYDYYLARRGYEAVNLIIEHNGSIVGLLERDPVHYRKIYIAGDIDNLSYPEEGYAVTVWDPYYRFMVLEELSD